MKINRILLGAIASFALANNVFATNKTHVTDSLGAGNSRADISYRVSSASLPGTFIFAGGPSFSIGTKMFASQLAVSYLLGVTDRLDMGVFLPLSEDTQLTQSYTIGTNEYIGTSKREGQGDVIFGARYLVLDKQQDKLSWNLSGTISPSTAPPDKGAAEIMTNGVVTTAGKTGQSGNGYMAATIASTLSIPIGAADIFLSGQFDKYGAVTTGSVTYQKGSSTSLSAGVESLLSEKITLTPYARLRINSASSYSSGTNIAANNDFDLGMSITTDISNSTSVRIGAEYNVVNDYAVTYANGNKLSFSGKGYTFTLSSMFFF